MDAEAEARLVDPEGRISMGPKGGTSNHGGLPLDLKTQWNLLCWVSNFFESSDPFIASDFSVWEWECLTNDCSTIVLYKQTTCFLASRPINERGFCSEWIIPIISLMPDLDDLEDEIW